MLATAVLALIPRNGREYSYIRIRLPLTPRNSLLASTYSCELLHVLQRDRRRRSACSRYAPSSTVGCLRRRVRHLLRSVQRTTTNNTAGSIISSAKVEGTSVYSPSGDKLGSVDDLIIDKISGQVRYAVMEFGGFFGIDTDRYPIPWDLLKYDTGLGGYVVPID